MEAPTMEESKQILVAVTTLQTNMDNLMKNMEEIKGIATLAVQTEQAAKSAHNRIDDLKDDVADDLKSQKEDFEKQLSAETKAREKMEGHITWLWRTVGAGGIALGFWLLQRTIGG
jgi:ElaB/YqjD/DUF883 family membrane-anchored ribosome-binding protein